MRVLLYLGLSVALLCLVVFADHKGKKHDHKDDHGKNGDDHEKKGDDHEKNRDDHEKKGDDHEKNRDDHEKKGDDHEKKGDDHEKNGDDHEKKGDDHEKKGDDHEKNGDDHEKKGDDHEKNGDDHEKNGDDHEKNGDDYEKKGDDHEKNGDDHEKNGDDHEKNGDDHEKKGDDHDPDHHRDNKQRSLADKILSGDKRKVGNKKFAFGLFSKVAADRPNENVVISPVSISTSLAFPSLGADGTTKDQITKGITMSETPKTKINHGFQNLQPTLNDDNRELHLDSGNRLFVSRALKIKENFLNKAKNFGSEVFTVNLEENEGAKKQINDYVEKNTNGKIVDVLSNADKGAAFFFVNFIYFRGQWGKPFDEKFTKEEDFHVNKDRAAKVPFMSQTGFYEVAELDEATVVSVPYKGNASALFILPKEGKMKEVESRQEDILTKYRSHCHRESIQLSIPKFSIDSTIDLAKPLHKLGIKTAFTDAADYSGKVGKVHHRVKTTVDEEGTAAAGTAVLKDIPTEVHHRVQTTVDEEGTAAAGTAVLKDIPTEAQSKAKINVDEKKTEAGEVHVLEAVPMKPPPPISFNRPFYISIYNKNIENILFMGEVANPEK